MTSTPAIRGRRRGRDDEAPVGPGTPRRRESGAAAGVGEVGGLRGLIDRVDLRHLPDALHLPEGLHLPDPRHLPESLRLPGGPHRADLPGPDEVAGAAREAAAAAHVWFLVDSLEHLRRGGRLSAPAAALGTVLGLRPLLTVTDGKVVVAEKIRTRKAARARIEAVAVTAAEGHERVRLVVHHLGQPGAAAELAARIAEPLGQRVREVLVSDAGAVLGAHVGPGLLAVVVAPA
jgi:hypothetical protein